MHSVRMNKMGLLAAVLYAVLEGKRSAAPVVGFRLNIELLSLGDPDNNHFGDIVGNIQVDSDQQDIREFTIRWCVEKTIVCEIKQNIVVPKSTDNYNACYLNTIGLDGIEIDFDKRTVRNRHVHKYDVANVNWDDLKAVKGLAMDIIGGILAEKNFV